MNQKSSGTVSRSVLEEPAEWATRGRFQQSEVLLFGLFVCGWPGPVAVFTVFFCQIIDSREAGLRGILSEVFEYLSPRTWPDHKILGSSDVLEKESFVAGFTRVEFCFEVDFRNFDPLSRLVIEIVCALWCCPSIDIKDFDSTFAVTIIIFILALLVEMVLESVVPLHVSIIREVMNTFILQLEWELGYLAVPSLISARNVHLFKSGSVRCYSCANLPPRCWSHRGRIRPFAAFKHLCLLGISCALVIGETFHTILESTAEEVPRRVVLT